MLGGRYLAVVAISAALVVVMCGCAAAFIRSLFRRRRQAKEQNATAQDVPEMSIESSGVLVSDEGPIAHTLSDEGPIVHAVSGHAPLDRKPTDFGVRPAPAESAIDEDDSALSPTACFEGICFGEALKVESMPSMCGATGGVREIELAAHTKSKTTVEL